MKQNTYDLTQGGILSRLLAVALPIIGTQFMQMAYNLINMYWLGKLGSGAVAASGTVGMLLLISTALMTLGRMGSEIGVSQNLGRQDPETAQAFAHTSLVLAAALGVAFAAAMMIFREPLISFFNLSEARVIADSQTYLLMISPGVPFALITAALSGSFSGSGNTKVAAIINVSGLVINMILDPILIFTAGLGIEGAAISTVFSQVVVCMLLVAAMKYIKSRPFENFTFLIKPDLKLLRPILKWGIPVATESLLYALLTIMISRMVAAFGTPAIAAYRVGSQIESLSWLIVGGYSSALIVFVGQNYGAGKWTRIHQGFRLSIVSMFSWGLVVASLMLFGAGFLSSIFLSEPETVALGIDYMKIFSLCQPIACIEFTTAGCFRGMGRTLPPSITGVCSNVSRLVVAHFLVKSMGINGIWWAIMGGAIVRGTWLFVWYCLTRRNFPKFDVVEA